MTESGWWERHGAVFTSIITLVSVLTYLHVSLSTIRDELRSETGSLRTELRTEMSSLRTEIRAEIKDLRASLDRVETKVVEVRGYLRFNAAATQDNPPPKE